MVAASSCWAALCASIQAKTARGMTSALLRNWPHTPGASLEVLSRFWPFLRNHDPDPHSCQPAVPSVRAICARLEAALDHRDPRAQVRWRARAAAPCDGCRWSVPPSASCTGAPPNTRRCRRGLCGTGSCECTARLPANKLSVISRYTLYRPGSAKHCGPCIARQGLVEAVGVSNYGPQQMQKIHRCPPQTAFELHPANAWARSVRGLHLL